ncbi:MAG: hypothetical protein ACYTGJ_05700 [Planctomycetota bacterium]
MENDKYRSLFGEVALERGYVTAAQLFEALTAQLKGRKQGREKLLGQVLLELGYLTPDQLQDVIDHLYPPEGGESPNTP